MPIRTWSPGSAIPAIWNRNAVPAEPGTSAASLGCWSSHWRLAAGLTLPRLRDRWNRPPGGTTGHPETSRFTAPERDEIYRHAARQARAAEEHIRRCAMSDPAAAADAAWAAADALHVAARALRNPHLRCAADSYDRAARAQYGRLPPRSHDGDQLRRTARLIALAGNLTGDATLTTIALVAQLVALAAAVAELREAQQLAAQAQAARAAAAHLQSAVNHSRPRAAGFGRARSRGPAPATSAAKLAGQDIPAGMRQPQPTPGSAEPARSRPPQQPRPGRRAGPAP